MTEKSFCYWLNGFFELSETDKLSEKQVMMIKEHLALVFNKVTTGQCNVDDQSFLMDLSKSSRTSDMVCGTYPPTTPPSRQRC